MTTIELTPRLQGIANKVAALQKLRESSGFQTKKSIRELLSPLNAEELALVAEAIQQ